MSQRTPSRILAPLLLATLAAFPAMAEELLAPKPLSASHGTLSLLMVARPANLPSWPGIQRQANAAYVFDTCLMPPKPSLSCPTQSDASLFAGPLLALNRGDTVKIHLVNTLPPVPQGVSIYPGMTDSQEAQLAQNPTNIHTHGLLVEPHVPVPGQKTYGDYVFIDTLPKRAQGAMPQPAQSGLPTTPAMPGMPAMPAMAMGATNMGATNMGETDYVIRIPRNHPSGPYWIHPHVHGVSLPQVSRGMAGTLTIGSPRDTLCPPAVSARLGAGALQSCRAFTAQLPVRHLILKDLQLDAATGTPNEPADPTVCGSATTPQNGYCADTKAQKNWTLPVNGQLYPTITMDHARTSYGGELWQIVNASGSMTRELEIKDPASNRLLIFKVLSLDGVAVDSETAGVAARVKGMVSVPCPGLPAGTKAAPLCVTEMLMMPSARAEIWVTYRGADGQGPAQPPTAPATYVFTQEAFSTGGTTDGKNGPPTLSPHGDTWPAANLAQIAFQPDPAKHPAIPAYIPTRAIFDPARVQDATVLPDATTCVSTAQLPAGHGRRIYFGVSPNQPNQPNAPTFFGLGYTEVTGPNTKASAPVPNSGWDITEIVNQTRNLCPRLGANNAPVRETWELVNLTDEDHNFHIHQTKFRILSAPDQSGAAVPGSEVYADNVPVPHSQNICSIAQYEGGQCVGAAPPTVVSISFGITGDFVYHCHILDHEDHGMMAKISVLPARLK